MRREILENYELIHGSMEETICGLERVDHIFTDPPYLYLNHELDKEFNEQILFENAKRLLPDCGIIALFGRGTSFYRWNTRLAELGFIFREEIVWDKLRPSGVSTRISRVHETVSIHTKRNGHLNKGIRIPYTEVRKNDLPRIKNDLRRIRETLNSKGLEQLSKTLNENKLAFNIPTNSRHGVNFAKERLSADVGCTSLFLINNGLLEKSIMQEGRCHYNTSHPTEKPIRLAERIIALISNPGDTIYDPFMGSGSFGIACINTGRKYIGSEINAKYFEIARKRITEIVSQTLF